MIPLRLGDYAADMTTVSIALGLIAAVLGFAWRIGLKALRADLTAILTNVSVNHHSSDEPTLPDRLDDVRTEIVGEVKALATRFDAHLLDAATDSQRLTSAEQRMDRAGI